MRLPTVHQLDQHLSALHKATQRANLARLEKHLRDAVQRDQRGGTTERDGFPAGGDGPRGSDVSDPTFSAATAKQMRDPHHDDTRAMLDALQAILAGFATLDNRARAIAARTAEAPELTRECAWHLDAGHPGHMPAHYGNLGGRVPTPVDLCEACYHYGMRHADLPEFRPDGSLARRVRDSRKACRSTVGTGGAFAWQDPA